MDTVQTATAKSEETTAEARIYVSDYATYNSGSLSGEWIDLDDKTVDEIQAKITQVLYINTQKLGELCEEVMIQDFEGFPEELYSESMGENELEKVVEYLELDEGDKDTLQDILYVLGSHYFDNAFQILQNGDFVTYSGKDEIVDEFIELNNVPENIQYYLDEEAIVRDELAGELHELENGGYIKIFN